ncbi:unnamed protein product [Moneuplotes crassus]|uniref:Peptidase A1 domain-containing protein n=1 Tax=Euplotes crassus TaxID=5936 RepID=A0AAD1UL50_EUPCR|nr:unnamed protein product [Moneuplotes crassus]
MSLKVHLEQPDKPEIDLSDLSDDGMVDILANEEAKEEGYINFRYNFLEVMTDKKGKVHKAVHFPLWQYDGCYNGNLHFGPDRISQSLLFDTGDSGIWIKQGCCKRKEDRISDHGNLDYDLDIEEIPENPTSKSYVNTTIVYGNLTSNKIHVLEPNLYQIEKMDAEVPSKISINLNMSFSLIHSIKKEDTEIIVGDGLLGLGDFDDDKHHRFLNELQRKYFKNRHVKMVFHLSPDYDENSWVKIGDLTQNYPNIFYIDLLREYKYCKYGEKEWKTDPPSIIINYERIALYSNSCLWDTGDFLIRMKEEDFDTVIKALANGRKIISFHNGMKGFECDSLDEIDPITLQFGHCFIKLEPEEFAILGHRFCIIQIIPRKSCYITLGTCVMKGRITIFDLQNSRIGIQCDKSF